ncbi:hypothetical protein Scep_010599 [Stephania cephalantha]|uniref:Uncharacterized protein n=1 Tax=Stephania cephalantha TaxID=152367 RepID=A0AAP0PDG0_9MAGN
MAKPFCLNNTNSDTDQFSSPVPFIGLYIAGGTSVCILLMVFDAIHGLRRKIRYIPCRFFSLNSITLTLLGVATKIPVDLTSYMPSDLDQLSKLSGTTVICIYMGSIFPSLGGSRESESISNLVALGIFVVTVFVNICIQISTKVIFSFVIEHILILCFMLILWFLLWYCTTREMKNLKDVLAERNRQLFENGKGSLMHRVKRWYMYSCVYNPQLLLCRVPPGVTAEIICVFCSIILLQAAYRLVDPNGNIKFCKGTSDYGWSMMVIIISQIVIVIVGSVTIIFRWVTLAANVDFFYQPSVTGSESHDFALHFYATKRGAMTTSIIICFWALLDVLSMVICLTLVIILGLVPLSLYLILLDFVEGFFPSLCQIIEGVSINSWKEEFQGIVIGKADELHGWVMAVCVNDMGKWRSYASKRFSSGSYMAQMLLRPRPSVQSTLLNKIQEIGRRHLNEYKVTCLSMVLLVKIVGVLVPSSLSESLRQAMDEAFEVIYFIDERINVGNFEDRRRREVAKLLWNGGDLNVKKDSAEHNTLVSYVLSTFEEVYSIACGKQMEMEVEIIRDFIQDHEYASIEELCDYLYQLFADLSHWFLAQFPASILKEVNESPVEEYEERAAAVLKLLYKLEPSLEDEVQWSFPLGANITRFFDPFENSDEGIPSDTTVGDVATAEGTATTVSIPIIRDVELGQTPMS